MPLAIVRSKSLILCGPRDKGAGIRQIPDLTDGAVMALLTPCRGLIKGMLRITRGGEDVKDSDRLMDRGRRIARETLGSEYSWEGWEDGGS